MARLLIDLTEQERKLLFEDRKAMVVIDLPGNIKNPFSVFQYKEIYVEKIDLSVENEE